MLHGPSSDWPELGCTLHQLFVKQAHATPEAIAVEDGPVRITYACLDALSSAFAHRLLQQGVQAEASIAIFMPRCWQYAVAYLGALKAGAAYMPLDVSLPKPLLLHMIQLSGTPVVCTLTAYAARLPDVTSAGTWCIESFPDTVDAMWTECDAAAVTKASDAAAPSSLAYAVFSSGTTGMAKLIKCPHRGAVNSYLSRFTCAPLKSIDKIGIGVFFVWELMRPWLRGACSSIIPDAVLANPVAMLTHVQSHGITRVLLTPTLCQAMLDVDGGAERMSGLLVIVLCGEVVTRALAQRLRTVLPDTKVLNNFSISECHGVATLDLAQWQPDFEDEFAPVGALMHNVSAIILDPETREPVALGQVGELYVSGSNLARCYASDQLTADRFVPNPWSTATDVDPRLYKTGDLARLLPHSEWLEIRGRCNSMQKVRGYSIQLGAVESALQAHPRIANVVCEARGSMQSRQLVAYMVETPSSSANDEEGSSDDHATPPLCGRDLLSFLRQQGSLPPYALPQVFMLMPKLPLHAVSNKCNRAALPNPPDAPQYVLPFGDVQVPVNDVEADLRRLWAFVLDVNEQRIGRDHAFGDVGGHSLMYAVLYARIQEHWPLATAGLTLSQLYENDTIESQAALLMDLGAGTTADATADDDSALVAEASPVQAQMTRDAQQELPGPPLSDPVAAALRKRVQAPRAILVTGGTGFLGTEVIPHLRQRYGAHVKLYVIVRSVSSSRLQAWDAQTIIVRGNLGQPRLGVSDDAVWSAIETEVDAIWHIGARVDFTQSYRALYDVNVGSTLQLLQLCLHPEHPKAMCYVSSSGVFKPSSVDDDQVRSVDTEAAAEVSQALLTGYARSKAVAETLVRRAHVEANVPLTIIRAGDIFAHSETGHVNGAHDMVRLFVGSLQLGQAPVSDKYVQLAALDQVAHFVAHAAAPWSGATHNVAGPEHVVLNDVFAWMRSLGWRLEPVTWRTWIKAVKHHPSNAYYSLFPLAGDFFRHNDARLIPSPMYPTYQASAVSVDNDEAGGGGEGAQQPVATSWQAQLLRMLHKMVSQGDVSRPNALFGRLAVITGASSGIGAACARELHGSGALVCLLARRLPRLLLTTQQLGPSVTHAVAVDVTQREAVEGGVAQAMARWGFTAVDVLVAAAGIMPCTFMKALEVQSWTRTMDVNVNGVLHAVGAVLGGMVVQKRGDIVFISSNAGRRGFDALAAYSGSKFALEGVAQAMRAEMYSEGVRVTSVQPGDVATELLDHDQPKDGLQPIVDAIEGCAKILEPLDVARAVCYALLNARHVSISEVLIEPSGTKDAQ